jgi:hypothetical protein
VASAQQLVCAHVEHEPRSVKLPEQVVVGSGFVVVDPTPPSEPNTALMHVSISEHPRFTQFCACAMAASP